MKLNRLIIATIFMGALSSAIAVPSLKVGDPAPPIKAAKWFKGQPVDKYETNLVYVVEFWSTICVPCTQSAPHLSELAKKFAGRARVIGVSVKEPENLKKSGQPDHAKRLDDIAKFLAKMGDKMDYSVAADDNDGFMQKHWLDAADEQGIPVAFVVGRDGTIAWIGYPWAGLDEKLEQVISGTLDSKAIQTEAAKRQEEKDARARDAALLKPITDLQSQHKSQEAIAALDQIVAVHPDMARKTSYLRFRLLLDFDEPAACRLARNLLEGECKDRASALYNMSRDMVEPPHKQMDWEVAIAVATRADELRGHDGSSLAVLAHAYYRKGDFAKAIETAELALAKSEGGLAEFIKKRLAIYRAAQQKSMQTKAEK